MTNAEITRAFMEKGCWGLAEFCPGPAVAALVTGLAPVFVFVAAMLAGMVLYAWVFERAGTPAAVPAMRGLSRGRGRQ